MSPKSKFINLPAPPPEIQQGIANLQETFSLRNALIAISLAGLSSLGASQFGLNPVSVGLTVGESVFILDTLARDFSAYRQSRFRLPFMVGAGIGIVTGAFSALGGLNPELAIPLSFGFYSVTKGFSSLMFSNRTVDFEETRPEAETDFVEQPAQGWQPEAETVKEIDRIQPLPMELPNKTGFMVVRHSAEPTDERLAAEEQSPDIYEQPERDLDESFKQAKKFSNSLLSWSAHDWAIRNAQRIAQLHPNYSDQQIKVEFIHQVNQQVHEDDQARLIEQINFLFDFQLNNLAVESGIEAEDFTNIAPEQRLGLLALLSTDEILEHSLNTILDSGLNIDDIQAIREQLGEQHVTENQLCDYTETILTAVNDCFNELIDISESKPKRGRKAIELFEQNKLIKIWESKYRALQSFRAASFNQPRNIYAFDLEDAI